MASACARAQQQWKASVVCATVAAGRSQVRAAASASERRSVCNSGSQLLVGGRQRVWQWRQLLGSATKLKRAVRQWQL